MIKKNAYLAHYGVKGMKWKNHIYTSIVGGEYIYSTNDISNRAAEMKKEGYSHDEIKSQIRSEMAAQRAQGLKNGGAAKDYSGAAQRAQQRIQQETKEKGSNNSSGKYEEELSKAKRVAEYQAEKDAANLEKKHAQYEVEKAERKAQKEAERKAQEEAEAKALAEKEAKKNAKKGKGGSGKKSSGKKGSSKKSDKSKENSEIQKKIDEGVKEALAKMGLSAEYMNSENNTGSLPEAQLNSLANSVIRGDLGTGSQRKAALGNHYNEVQKLVNQKLSKSRVISKGAKKPEKQQEIKYGPSKRVKHSMMNDTNYIEHHGTLGQRWRIRRYQNYDGSLTDLGREHYGIGKRRYQNEDGTLTEAGIKKYTKYDRKTGGRVLNRKGQKFYNDQVKADLKAGNKLRKDIVKQRIALSDEDLEKLTKRIESEKKLYETYANSTLSGKVKKELTDRLVKKGTDALADVAVNATLNLGSKAINKALDGKLKNVKVSDFTNDLMNKKADQEFQLHMHDTQTKYNNAKEAAENAAKEFNKAKLKSKKDKSIDVESYASKLDRATAAMKDAEKALNIEKTKQNYVKGLAKLNEEIAAKERMDKYISSTKQNNYNFASNLIKQRDKK